MTVYESRADGMGRSAAGQLTRSGHNSYTGVEGCSFIHSVHSFVKLAAQF